MRLGAARPGAFDAYLARDLQVLALVYFSRKDLARTRQTSEEALAIFNRLRNANAMFEHESMARCMLLYAAVTERENFSRACTMVGEAAEFATDASTRQASQLEYQKCSRNPAFRPPR